MRRGRQVAEFDRQSAQGADRRKEDEGPQRLAGGGKQDLDGADQSALHELCGVAPAEVLQPLQGRVGDGVDLLENQQRQAGDDQPHQELRIAQRHRQESPTADRGDSQRQAQGHRSPEELGETSRLAGNLTHQKLVDPHAQQGVGSHGEGCREGEGGQLCRGQVRRDKDVDQERDSPGKDLGCQCPQKVSGGLPHWLFEPCS